jgi:hypothetical protein
MILRSSGRSGGGMRLLWIATAAGGWIVRALASKTLHQSSIIGHYRSGRLCRVENGQADRRCPNYAFQRRGLLAAEAITRAAGMVGIALAYPQWAHLRGAQPKEN